MPSGRSHSAGRVLQASSAGSYTSTFRTIALSNGVAVPPNTVPLPIPAMAGLAGLDLYLQGVFADPLTTPNYAASDGLRLTLIGTGCP